MTSVSIDGLAKVPYISNVPRDGRTVRLQPFWDRDAGEWVPLHPVGGSLMRLRAEPVSGLYWGQEPENTTADLYIPLCNLIHQHVSWPSVAGSIRGLEEDFHNLGAVLNNYQLISNAAISSQPAATHMIATELEYLLSIVRSMYDGLQSVCRNLAMLIKRPNALERRLIADLPGSFAGIALSGKTVRSEDEMISRFQLPSALARFYHEEGPVFEILRSVRGDIEHYGASTGIVVNVDRGLAMLAAGKQSWQEQETCRGIRRSDRRYFGRRRLDINQAAFAR